MAGNIRRISQFRQQLRQHFKAAQMLTEWNSQSDDFYLSWVKFDAEELILNFIFSRGSPFKTIYLSEINTRSKKLKWKCSLSETQLNSPKHYAWKTTSCLLKYCYDKDVIGESFTWLSAYLHGKLRVLRPRHICRLFFLLALSSFLDRLLIQSDIVILTIR